MAEHFRFFNSTETDIREYQSSEFAEYFSMFLSDGIYTENGLMGLKVSTVNGLNIKVGTGFAFIRGYLYKNDSDINFILDPADVVLDRIDRIVLKLDVVNRTMAMTHKKGTMGSNPIPPTLIDNASVKELPIAQIRINKNATTGIITDERVPVHSLIDIPYGDMVEEFNEWFEERRQSVGVEIYTGAAEPSNMVAGDIWLRELI